MCGAGGGEGTHSSCGSYFNANRKDFPSVPYSNLDFNDGKCHTGSGNIENYNDVNQVKVVLNFSCVVCVSDLITARFITLAGEKLPSGWSSGPRFGEGLRAR